MVFCCLLPTIMAKGVRVTLRDILTANTAELQISKEQAVEYAARLEAECLHTLADLTALSDVFFPHLPLPTGIKGWLYTFSKGSQEKGSTFSAVMPKLLASGWEVPAVEVTLKVYSIDAFDPINGRFFCDFNILLDWIDPRLRGKQQGDTNFDSHFVPEVYVDNAAGDLVMVGGQSAPRMHCPVQGWGKLTQRYKGELLTTSLDFHSFPFDRQILPIVLKSRTLTRDSLKQRVFVRLTHPSALRPTVEDKAGVREYASGHVLVSNVTRHTPEWGVAGICGAEDSSSRKDAYTVKVVVERRYANIAWNVMLPVLSITTLSFIPFGVAIEDLGGREEITLTLFLTCTTLKYLTREVLPAVPYLTMLDKYIVQAMLVTWANAVEHVVVYATDSLVLDRIWLFCCLVWFVVSHALLLSCPFTAKREAVSTPEPSQRRSRAPSVTSGRA